MKYIITLLAFLLVASTYSCEVANEPEVTLPQEVKGKVLEIQKLREEHRKAMEVKIQELKEVLKGHPKLQVHVMRMIIAKNGVLFPEARNLPERLEDRRENNEPLRERVRDNIIERRRNQHGGKE